jgi:L,D-peptidoglycan transpeptidase YkuD (ErfK/YbiS/YcfS/YnhG family)
MIILIPPKIGTTKTYVSYKNLDVKCCIGSGGLIHEKKEGDGCTPIGSWPLRRVFYRSDKMQKPITVLSIFKITKKMGWCDDPLDPNNYNSLIETPYKYKHERLWRDDEIYDVVVELGYNDRSPVLGKGSAIFMHIAREGFPPTKGCIALEKIDLLNLLSKIDVNENLEIKISASGGPSS